MENVGLKQKFNNPLNKKQMAKYQATKSKFLDWYLSDSEDEMYLGRNLVYLLKEDGQVNLKVEDLIEWVRYVPEHICVGYEDKDYDRIVELNPKDVELID